MIELNFINTKDLCICFVRLDIHRLIYYCFPFFRVYLNNINITLLHLGRDVEIVKIQIISTTYSVLYGVGEVVE